MIDIGNEVINAVYNAVHATYPSCFITGEYVRKAPSFPTVTVIEADNTAYGKTTDSGSNEKHAVIVYEVNVYSNKRNGAKQEAYAIAQLVDTAFGEMGFMRNMLNPVPNFDDATIFRIVARYRGVVSTGKNVYRK